jgi:hypothetical protein
VKRDPEALRADQASGSESRGIRRGMRTQVAVKRDPEALRADRASGSESRRGFAAACGRKWQ